MAGFTFKISTITGHTPQVWDGLGPEITRIPGRKVGASPPEDILAYWGKHEGEPICIIANGPSAKTVDLDKITCATIGLNRAWELGDWDYYCIGDQYQFKMYEEKRGPISQLSPLFSGADGPDHAIRIQALHHRQKAFSFDLVKGVYLNNTVTCFGLHLAVWMQANPIYIVGLDCVGKHFWGGNPIEERKFSNQRETFGYIAGLCEGIGPHKRQVGRYQPLLGV
jgi:hypothetical protein